MVASDWRAVIGWYDAAAGSCEDKLQLLFMMYDRDRSGSLSRTEVSEMIRFVYNQTIHCTRLLICTSRHRP